MSDTGESAAPQAVDRKDLLREQFTEVEQSATTQTDAPATAAAPAAAPQSPERARDEAGKFTAKQDKTPGGVTQQAAVAAPAASHAQIAPPVEAPAWEKPPKSWRKDKHELWTAMTPDQREYAFLREEQMRTSVESAMPKAELADKINKAAEPYINNIRGLGMDLPTAVGGLMKVDNDLRTLPFNDRLQLFLNIGRGYGIDLSGQAQNAQPGFDPMVQHLQNELLDIKGQFTSFTQAQEAAQQQTALDEIQRFSKNAEHFDDVKPTMGQLLQSGLAVGIQDAYEKAIRLHPEIFDSIQSARQAATEAEKRAAADAAAKKAKAAAVSVKSATPGANTPANAQDRRSMLREQFASLSERL